MDWWCEVTIDRAKVTEADRWCSGSVVCNEWLCLLVLLEGLGRGKNGKKRQEEVTWNRQAGLWVRRELGRRVGVS